MRSVIRGFTIITTLIYLNYVECDTIGGFSPEKWSSKCKKHFDRYGDEASNIPLYISGYCERYKCQKYGHDMYGVITDECKRVTIHRSNCKIVKSNKNKQYPHCCPKVECDRRKAKMHSYEE